MVMDLPLQLFRDIVGGLLHDLLHNPDVLFGIVAELGGFTEDGGTGIGSGVNELLSELIQRRDTASQVVKTTSDGAVSTALLVQEINERLLGPTAIVGNRVLLVFLALSEEFDGGEGRDAIHLGDGLVVRLIGVHIGDNAVLLLLEVPRDVFVNRFQGLTVSTPRGSERDESTLGDIQCDRVEVVNSKRLDRGWGRWFQFGLNPGLVGNAVRWLTRIGMVDQRRHTI